MNNIIETLSAMLSYSLLSGIVMALMYLTYKWLLADKSFHCFNRGILYIIYTVSASLPLLYAQPWKLSNAQISIAAPIVSSIEISTATSLPTNNSVLPLIIIGI